MWSWRSTCFPARAGRPRATRFQPDQGATPAIAALNTWLEGGYGGLIAGSDRRQADPFYMLPPGRTRTALLLLTLATMVGGDLKSEAEHITEARTVLLEQRIAGCLPH